MTKEWSFVPTEPWTEPIDLLCMKCGCKVHMEPTGGLGPPTGTLCVVCYTPCTCRPPCVVIGQDDPGLDWQPDCPKHGKQSEWYRVEGAARVAALVRRAVRALPDYVSDPEGNKHLRSAAKAALESAGLPGNKADVERVVTYVKELVPE
jgi:hypothetical protein